jgi:hypothetical protein
MSAGYRKEPDKAIPIMGETEEPVPWRGRRGFYRRKGGFDRPTMCFHVEVKCGRSSPLKYRDLKKDLT